VNGLGLALALFVLAGAAVVLMTMAVAGVEERVPRAVGVSLGLLAATAAIGLLLVMVRGTTAGTVGTWSVVAAAGIFALVSVLPFGTSPPPVDTGGAVRFDERDHMFSRANLRRHPELRRRYHEMRPEKKDYDHQLDILPELGQPGSRFYDPEISPMAEAAFSVLERSYLPLAQRPRGPRGLDDPVRLARAVEMLARRYGAVDVGIVRTAPYHWYSHAGRHADGWGEPIEPDHPTAIVLVVAMDFHTIRMAPSAPVLAESSRQYVEAAKIAHLVAEYLELNGHEARAHVDGRYQVLCAPLAEDAGLGHVGRIGILMHRRYGPCVRLSVVTTTARLPVTRGDHSYMESFCRICRKCAENCPTRSLPHGERPVSRGFAHWSVDQESCYAFWRRTGTDCSVCIASCPFTKPDTRIHRLVRAYIRRNPLNRRLALLGDDLFYGRRLKLRPSNPSSMELARRWKIRL